MHLWTRITQGLAALMLSAAALALLFFAGALLLGIAAVVLLAAGGLWLAAPDEARRTITLVSSRVDQWIESMRSIVDDAGALLQAVLGRHQTTEQAEDKKANQAEGSMTTPAQEQAKKPVDKPVERPVQKTAQPTATSASTHQATAAAQTEVTAKASETPAATPATPEGPQHADAKPSA